MARRRSRSLAGSPAHHAAETKRLARSAFEQYHIAAEEADAGNCMRAFREFTKAVENDGKAGAHFMEIPKTENREMTALADEIEDAHKLAFRNIGFRCIINKSRSSLAGHRRRSRR